MISAQMVKAGFLSCSSWRATDCGRQTIGAIFDFQRNAVSYMSADRETGSEFSYIRDLTQYELNELSLDDVVYCHLSRRGWEPIKGHTIYTTLDHIETEMRQARGTNLTSNYVPLLAGFSILEQLGDTYADRSMQRHPQNGGGIEHALYYFCGYPAMSPEVKALYALRNGLIHAASLTSTDQGSNARYIYRYDYEMDAGIVMPAQPWDGQIKTIHPDVFTIVNPRQITDQVSAAISRVRDYFFHEHGRLKVKRSKGQILINHLIWR